MDSVTPAPAPWDLDTLSLATLLAITSDSPSETGIKNERDYAVLKRRIQDAGLLDKRPGYYALSITTNLVLWTVCLVVLFTVGSVWAQALTAAVLGIISGQLGFQLLAPSRVRPSAQHHQYRVGNLVDQRIESERFWLTFDGYEVGERQRLSDLRIASHFEKKQLARVDPGKVHFPDGLPFDYVVGGRVGETEVQASWQVQTQPGFNIGWH